MPEVVHTANFAAAVSPQPGVQESLCMHRWFAKVMCGACACLFAQEYTLREQSKYAVALIWLGSCASSCRSCELADGSLHLFGEATVVV